MVFIDGPDVVWDIELLCDVAEIFVVADDAWDFDVPLAGFVSCEDIVEAVAHFADEDGHSRGFIAEVEIEGEFEAFVVEGVQDVADFVARDIEIFEFPFDAHEEHAVDIVDILVDIDDIAAVIGDEAGEFGDDALSIGAVEQEDCSWAHNEP